MIQTVNNTVAVSDTPPIVEASIQKIKNIATLPAVAQKIMGLVDDPQSNMEDLSKAITNDPALCSRILKVVNSSFYGMPQQVGSIDRAVVLLGLNAVKNIAIAASLHRVFQPKLIGGDFAARDLWTHSVAVATAARGIAVKAGFGLPDEAFLAGLIHDIGIMVEMQACSVKFVAVIESLSEEPSPTFRQAEEQILGATHEAFGAGLCRAWKFPVYFENVAGFHHQPMQLPEEDRALPAVVHIADVLAAQNGIGYTRTVEVDAVAPEVYDALHLSEPDIEAVGETLTDAVEETLRLLSDS